MRKNILLLGLISLFLISAQLTEVGSYKYNTKELSATFSTKDGMFEGQYVSYYPNKRKKAEGRFSANMRVGLWTIWYPNGKLAIKREYKNDYEYKSLFPEFGKKGKRAQVNSLTRNATGFYSYFQVKENSVVQSKRLWRFIPRNDTTPVFIGNLLWSTLIDSVRQDKIQAFVPSDDEFRIKMEKSEFEKFTDTSISKIIGYKIKEDWFFDSKRKISEKRIIGICPVVRMDQNQKDSVDVCWFYFPDLRNAMNSIVLDIPGLPKGAQTMDDVFFFRFFRSTIYKELNDQNLCLKDFYKPELISQEQIRIEIELIETEHDLWVSFSK